MSLISDALKLTQATHAQQKPVPSEAKVATPVAPIAPAPVPVATATPAVLVKIIIAASLVIVVLALILTPLAYRIWHKRETPHSPVSQISQKPQPAPVVKSDVALLPVIEQLKALQHPDKQTAELLSLESKPTVSIIPLPQPGEPTKLILQGILIDRHSREALINGISVKEGDSVAGARVISIDRKQVTLQFDGRDLVLRM